ncbi:unnamed protein product [Amoebophrya sp. A120]|nr:unnamed protein product [Amoebophrya sp. A120]|eukprot:GSA120T00020977001.1
MISLHGHLKEDILDNKSFIYLSEVEDLDIFLVDIVHVHLAKRYPYLIVRE